MSARDPIVEARRQWIEHGWADVADSMAAVTTVMRVHQLLSARMEAVLKPHGLTFARYELLQLLSFTKNGMMLLGKIGARLQVHPASVTNAVDRLEADRLVRRVTGHADRRKTFASITPLGRQRAAEATVDVNAEFALLDLPATLYRDLHAVATRLAPS